MSDGCYSGYASLLKLARHAHVGLVLCIFMHFEPINDIVACDQVASCQ